MHGMEITCQHIRHNIGQAACYEQLAEEAAELAQAALKVARVLRNENPTPIEFEEALDGLRSEYSDVSVCADVVDLTVDADYKLAKFYRWLSRIEEKETE